MTFLWDALCLPTTPRCRENPSRASGFFCAQSFPLQGATTYATPTLPHPPGQPALLHA
jgi:hypothetical protein